MVQRYILEDECVMMEKHDRGDWVNYEDYDKLRKERDGLKEYERYANEYKDWIALKQRIKELEERNQILYEEMVSLGVIPDRLLPKKH